MKKLLLLILMTFSLSILAADNDYLGFALKQTGSLNMSYDNQIIESNPQESRMEILWYRSQLPAEEMTYTVTMKHGGWVRVMNDERTIKIDMKKGDKLTFSLKEMWMLDIIAYEQYGLEVQMNEAGSRPVLIQMPRARKFPATEFEAYFVK